MASEPQEQAAELQDLTAFSAQQQWKYERERRAWAEEVGRPLNRAPEPQ